MGIGLILPDIRRILSFPGLPSAMHDMGRGIVNPGRTFKDDVLIKGHSIISHHSG